jgi:hypothetical protein
MGLRRTAGKVFAPCAPVRVAAAASAVGDCAAVPVRGPAPADSVSKKGSRGNYMNVNKTFIKILFRSSVVDPKRFFSAGLWIRIDLIGIRIPHFCSIRIRIRFRIQAKTELSKTILFSNFFEIKNLNQIKNNGVIHQNFFQKVVSAIL